MDFSKQKHFLETFGYLVAPGLLKEDMSWIEKAFEAALQERGAAHDRTKRTGYVAFVDQSERLCTLLDHPGVEALLSGLLGENFNYIMSDGNCFVGDTHWHIDGAQWGGLSFFLKVGVYLDPVTRDTGCLRTIPGAHRVDYAPGWNNVQARDSLFDPDGPNPAMERWGIDQRDMPSVAMESQPGDVVMFRLNMLHAAFGGSDRRRMLSLVCCPHCETEEEVRLLETCITKYRLHPSYELPRDVMRKTASPRRMRHLQQVLEIETRLLAQAPQEARAL